MLANIRRIGSLALVAGLLSLGWAAPAAAQSASGTYGGVTTHVGFNQNGTVTVSKYKNGKLIGQEHKPAAIWKPEGPCGSVKKAPTPPPVDPRRPKRLRAWEQGGRIHVEHLNANGQVIFKTSFPKP